jgi:hypothetical protein
MIKSRGELQENRSDMSQKYTSDELFHFVGWHHAGNSEKNYEILCEILTDQCVHTNPTGKAGERQESL